MSLISWFAERQSKALRASPAVLESMADRTFSPYPLIASPPQARRIDAVYCEAQNASYGWMFRYQPSVRRVVDYIARNVAQLGLKVYERVSDDEREHRGDHPAAEALRKPNPHTPGEQFIYELVTDFLVYDNAYALKFRGDDGRLLLVRLLPHMVGLVGRSHFTIDAYRIWRADGTSFDVNLEDMVHWRGYNPDDPRRGDSKLETLREELASDLASRKSVTELHRSGLSLPGWIERPVEAPEWGDEGARRFREDWANQAQEGKRRTPVLEEGMVYKQGGVTPEDAEYLASRQFTVGQVAAMYGMQNCPPKDKDERTQFYADVLPPITDLLAAFLGLHLLQAEYGDDDHYFEFNLDEKLIGDDRLKALTSAAGAPPLTRNEARARLNLPAKEGGDDLITPLNVTVGGKPSPQVMPIQDPNKPSQDGDFREEDAPMPAGRQSLNGHQTKAQLLPRRAAQERRHREYVGEFEAPLKRFVNRMSQTLKSNGWDRKAIEDERYAKELAADLKRTATRIVAREGGIWATRIGLADIDMGQVRNYLSTFSEEKAKEVSQALRDALRGAEKPAEILTQAKDVAAPRAATTMATAMAAFAVKEAARQSPDAETRTKTWVVTSANSEHPEMDGESVLLGETFSNGADGPPADHPGCQCLMEIDGGGHPAPKSIEPQTKAQPVSVNVTAPDIHLHQSLEVPEGAFQFKAGDVTVEPPPPAEVNVTSPTVNVAPAELHIEEGAVSAPVVNVEAPAPTPAPEVTFEKGAISTNVEAPPPANVNIEDGALRVDVAPANVNVEAPEAPSVNVTMEPQAKTTKRVVRDKDGNIKEIIEENRKQTVKRDPETNRIQSIEEE